MVFSFLARFVLVYARVGYVNSNDLIVGIGKGEGGMHPAVGFQNVLGDIVVLYAVYRVAKVLSATDQNAERHQDKDGEPVVQAEDVVVVTDAVDFYKVLEVVENLKHF